MYCVRWARFQAVFKISLTVHFSMWKQFSNKQKKRKKNNAKISVSSWILNHFNNNNKAPPYRSCENENEIEIFFLTTRALIQQVQSLRSIPRSFHDGQKISRWFFILTEQFQSILCRSKHQKCWTFGQFLQRKHKNFIFITTGAVKGA